MLNNPPGSWHYWKCSGWDFAMSTSEQMDNAGPKVWGITNFQVSSSYHWRVTRHTGAAFSEVPSFSVDFYQY